MSFPHASGVWLKELQVSTERSLFHGARVYNKSGATFYLWICDDTSGAPTDPDLAPIAVAAGGHEFIDWIQAPRLMEAGIYVAACTAPNTFGLIAAADAFFEVAWKPFP